MSTDDADRVLGVLWDAPSIFHDAKNSEVRLAAKNIAEMIQNARIGGAIQALQDAAESAVSEEGQTWFPLNHATVEAWLTDRANKIAEGEDS